MQSTEKPDFKGSGVLLLKHSMLYVLMTTPVLSFCLMGTHWPRIFFAMLALSFPFVLLLVLLISRYDRISFDDDKQQIVKPIGRPLPYQSIKRIDISETGRLVQVGIRQSFFHRAQLLYAMDGTEKFRLLESLRKRVPDSVVINDRHNVNWKSVFLILLLFIFLTAGFHLYLLRINKEIPVLPRQIVWETTKRSPKGLQQYTLGNFSFMMPARFQLIGKEEGALQFEDKVAKNEVRFFINPRKGIPRHVEWFIRYITGIRDYYDVLDMAFFTRVGVVPLVLKDIALAGLTGIKISALELAPPPRIDSVEKIKEPTGQALKGFLTQGKRKDKNTVSVLLVSNDREELHVFFAGLEQLDEKTVQKIVSEIRPISNR